MRSRDPKTQARRAEVAFLLLAALAASPAALGADVPAPGRPVAVAVLNFANRKPGDGWDWAEKALADLLIADLSQCRSLQVLCRERMQLLLDELHLGEGALTRPETGREVGRVAAADQVLAGSFWVDRGILSVELHRVEVRSGRVVRVESAKGPQEDFFAIEKSLARLVLGDLGVPLTDAERRRLEALPALSLPAAKSFYAGLGLYDDGRYEDALAMVRHTCRAAPGHADAHFWRGRLYQQAGEPEHALLAYEAMLGRFPRSRLAPDALYQLGHVFSELGRPADAVAAFKRLAKQFPSDPFATMVTQDQGSFTTVSTEHWVRLEIARALESCGADAEAADIYLSLAPEGFTATNLNDGLFDERGEIRWREPPGLLAGKRLDALLVAHYLRTGEPLVRARAVVALTQAEPSYAEDYSTEKRFRDAIRLTTYPPAEGPETANGGIGRDPVLGPFIRGAWFNRDLYLLAAPPGQAFASVHASVHGQAERNDGSSYRLEFLSADGLTEHGACFGTTTKPATASRTIKFPPGTALVRLRVFPELARIYRWQVRAEFRPLGSVGSLDISSVPEEADVTLDGLPVGKTPCTVPNVPAGEHVLKASAREYHCHKCGGVYAHQAAVFGRFDFPETRVQVAQGRTTAVFLPPPEGGWELHGWCPPRLLWQGHRENRGYAQDIDGRGRIAFAGSKLGDIEVSVRTVESPWQALRRLPSAINTPGREEMPGIAFEPDGALWLAYLSVGPRDYAILVTHSADGVRWSPPRRAATSKRRPACLVLRAVAPGRAVVVWRVDHTSQYNDDGRGLFATTVSTRDVPTTARLDLLDENRIDVNAPICFLAATDGTWHVVAGRHVFSCTDGRSWHRVGTLECPGLKEWRAAWLLEARPGTFWIVARDGSTGGNALLESHDLKHCRELTALPTRSDGTALFRDREGRFWLCWPHWFARSREPGFPICTPAGPASR